MRHCPSNPTAFSTAALQEMHLHARRLELGRGFMPAIWRRRASQCATLIKATNGNRGTNHGRPLFSQGSCRLKWQAIADPRYTSVLAKYLLYSPLLRFSITAPHKSDCAKEVNWYRLWEQSTAFGWERELPNLRWMVDVFGLKSTNNLVANTFPRLGFSEYIKKTKLENQDCEETSSDMCVE